MKCCDMNAGMLREPITIERAARTSDGAGGFTVAWAAISGAPDRAHVKALSGSERYAADRTEATTRWRITFRYFDGLLESDRVIIRTRAYNIRFINNLELRDKWLTLDLDGGVAT
jgi:SPP1 family predicted phage head-tail adaptor